MTQAIENPMVTYREPEAPVYTACRLCLRDILEGEAIYEMPDGAVICEDCLEDWAADYRQTASREWPEPEERRTGHGGAL